jgi:hypothetical protein
MCPDRRERVDERGFMGGFRCVQMDGLGVDMVCRNGGISRYRNGNIVY